MCNALEMELFCIILKIYKEANDYDKEFTN